MSIAAGEYDALVMDHAIREIKGGHFQFAVAYKVFDQGQEHTVYGTFFWPVNNDNPNYPKAREITEQAFQSMGMKQGANWADLAKGAGNGVLDEESLVRVKVIKETYDNKETTKVGSVWRHGQGGNFRNSIDPAEAVKKMAGMKMSLPTLDKPAENSPQGSKPAAPTNTSSVSGLPNHAPTGPRGDQSESPGFDPNENIPF